MIKKIYHQVLFKNKRFYASFPAITTLENNNLLVVFRRARDVRWLIHDRHLNNKSVQQLKQQVDHIDSRSQLVAITLNSQVQPVDKIHSLSADPEAADQDASLLRLQNGDILLSSFSYYPIPAYLVPYLQKQQVNVTEHPDSKGCQYIGWGGFTRLSRDNGKTWSKHNYLPILPDAPEIVQDKRPSHGGSPRGQAVEIGNEIILPVYLFLPQYQTDTAHCYVSQDGGISWHYRAQIAADPDKQIYFHEPSLIACDHKLIAFMRTARTGDHIYTAESYDQGETWTPAKKRSLIGHPPHPLKLKDGRIFLCYGFRHQPYGIRARFMDPEGNHFLGEEIIIRSDGACADLGYPWAAQLENGNIVVVYYFNNDDGIRHIAASILEL